MKDIFEMIVSYFLAPIKFIFKIGGKIPAGFFIALAIFLLLWVIGTVLTNLFTMHSNYSNNYSDNKTQWADVI